MGDLPVAAGMVLTDLAREAIERRLGIDRAHGDHDGPWLDDLGATFVTLTQDGRLRGCIGSLTAHWSLRSDVEHNAVAAAVSDPRFPPLNLGELRRTQIEVSVLSAPSPFPVADEADACARVQPGADGIILEYGSHRATFLPQVWESLPDPHDFFAHLKRKAGLPSRWWDPAVRLSRYSVTAFHEGIGGPG